ncbi:uncharacterized protein N7483_002162 [Penicillium malachiteum]|uniref:uncharacterized protein n=1 Tax=Penicillium malachiteum TaxID=1324776 RepID=UPI0025498CA7|nr:uncharacterized protein N7483_002162 [Penicillium malachiteum]KAJ5737037.1 hypothetical protein N7483_002162 [Penicillium malachiteum]
MADLYAAVKQGDISLVQAAMDNGAEVNDNEYEHLREAIKTNNQELVGFLLPHCNPERAFGGLETAISNGLFEVADLLLQSGRFRYPQGWATDSEYAHHMRFPARKGEEVFNRWQAFLMSRKAALEELLDPLYRGYALLYGVTSKNGHGLVRLLLSGQDLEATLNCRVWVEDEFETPLTAAAESGNLTLIQGLIGFPQIDYGACGKYGWPAFIHLLCNESCADSPEKWAVIERLAERTPEDLCLDRWGKETDSLCATAMRIDHLAMVKRVMDFVWDIAKARIIPLLIHTNQTSFVRWMLEEDVVPKDTPKPSPLLWLPICRDLAKDGEDMVVQTKYALEDAVEFWVHLKIYDYALLALCRMGDFAFAEQFFYGPFHDRSVCSEIPPLEVSKAAILNFKEAAERMTVLRPWVTQEYDASAFWNAYHNDYDWLFSRLKDILQHPFIDPNKMDPHAGYEGRPSFPDIPHDFFTEDEIEIEEVNERPFRVPEDTDFEQLPLLVRGWQVLLLERRNERRLVRDRHTPLTWAVATKDIKLVELLLTAPLININFQDRCWRTALMFAIMVSSQEIVKLLISQEYVNLNAQDIEGRTAIFYAAQTGDEDMVRILLESGKVDLEIVDSQLRTAKHLAMDEGHDHLIPLLWTA